MHLKQEDPGLSPIHDLDSDDLDNDLETENIVADPYKESPLVLRKKMSVDPPAHEPINILSKAIDSCQLFTTDELVSDGNTLEEGTYTVIDRQVPGTSFTVRNKDDMIQSTPVRSTNSPVLTPPPNSPPYEESTSPPVQTGQSTQSNPVQSLICEQSTQSN